MNPILFRTQIAEIIAALGLRPWNKDYVKQTPPAQVILGANDFATSYQDMLNRGISGYDKYAHAKANANATKRGFYGEKTAQVISALREFNDALKHYDQEPIDLVFDIQEDLDADKYGREQAKKYPHKNTHDIIPKYWIKNSAGHVVK